ncbi:MAG: PilZ domain-containing protein [Gammaproteobacteria bacterium]|nr:PilZ domain-containing protein [Gammaproteobacteria bacterium]
MSEKRDYPRMEIECPASFTVQGENTRTGAIVKNLSGGGVLMWIEGHVEPGTQLNLEVSPPSTITPSMHARMKVLRCTPVDGAQGQFAVACIMEKIFD